jgi:GDPmannose 4,6-dehydratase
MHVFYASSCKIFGGAMRGAVDLDTPRDGKCLYSITKKASGALAEHYRAAHGLRVTVGILFNHESERRPPGFFIPKVCRILQAALSDPSHREHVHTLGFCCDWSAADDFMRMAVRAADRGHSGDLIFASGETWNGREFVRELFARHGLDYRQHVIEDAPGEGEAFSADAGTAWRALDFRPSRHIFAVCSALVGHGGGPASSCI